MVHKLIILNINAISAGTKFRKNYSEIICNYPEADIYAQRQISSKKPNKVDFLEVDTPGNVHFVKVSDDTTIALAVVKFAEYGIDTHKHECDNLIKKYITENANENYKINVCILNNN